MNAFNTFILRPLGQRRAFLKPFFLAALCALALADALAGAPVGEMATARGAPCALSPASSQLLLDWILAEQRKEWIRPVPIVALPEIRWTSQVSLADKKKFRPDIYESADAQTQINAFIPSAGLHGQIWMADSSRVDQLVHELRHALQFADDPETTGTSDEEEGNAIRWQLRHERQFGRAPLCHSAPLLS